MKITGGSFPRLFVELHFLPGTSPDSFIYCHRIFLADTVLLARNPKLRIPNAAIWTSQSHLGTVQQNKVGVIKNSILRNVDEFIEAYLAANRKQVKKITEDKQMITGTVRYIDLEGGFFGLIADTGQRYDPVKLPEEYKKDGLRVSFQVKQRKATVGFHMWGTIVEIIKIEKL